MYCAVKLCISLFCFSTEGTFTRDRTGTVPNRTGSAFVYMEPFETDAGVYVEPFATDPGVYVERFQNGPV